MKAIRLRARGGPEQLVYEDAPDPQLRSGDALVRVCACAFTRTELSWNGTYSTRDGKDRLPSIPGHELSGVVEALGPNAVDVKVGDEVFALADFFRDGAAADYVAVHAADLAPKPESWNHVQAAAAPLAALTAWQALFDHAGLKAGQEVLIHGATGGVGCFAVQLAHWRGAFVVGTTGPQNEQLALELGADRVIDYTKARFEDEVHAADVVLDTVGGDTLERSWSAIRPGGVLVSIVDSIPAGTPEQYGVRGIYFIVEPSRTELLQIRRLVEAHRLRSVIEATFPLQMAREAFEHGANRHNHGKIVLQVNLEDGADLDVEMPRKAA
jgi:NADPH:quinone reductase-like Zn-dependent oxidoreductase